MMNLDYSPMLNVYPDSMGGNLSELAYFLEHKTFRGAFGSVYILPSLFHYDLDRGFSVIDYELNEEYARPCDLERIRGLGISLKLDFVLNHASVNSPQFRDLLEKGEKSEYKDFFIDWNKFWEGCGEMTPEGYIQPDQSFIKDMFFRKPGLPLLNVRFPDGTAHPYWNTFYQKVEETPEGPRYSGQMDLNIKSPRVWDYYRETIGKLASYGASIVRLDAFAYAPKEPGARNFLNEPGTWARLDKIDEIAEPYGITLLPEIHDSYEKGTYKLVASKGYPVYDFFLPGLILDAIEQADPEYLVRWAKEIVRGGIFAVNMLGCHDGIPLLDLKGLLPDDRIEKLIETVVERGGIVKDLHGAKNVYYQVNATYYSALGCDDRKLMLARAIQVFMPGKPQVWYLDLLAGKNDLEAVRRAGEGGHKEINRTSFTREEIERRLHMPVVFNQLGLMRLRGKSRAFDVDATFSINSDRHLLEIVWEYGPYQAELLANILDLSFHVIITSPEEGSITYSFNQ